MLDELYQGKYAWVLTPDAVLNQSMKQIASRFPDQVSVTSERPCMYLAGGEIKIQKSEVIKFRTALMELKDATFIANLTKIETRAGFLVWTCNEVPENIKRLALSCETFLQPFSAGLHITPFSGLIAISRLQKNQPVETFEQSETFHAEHLQFVELDDNLFNRRARFQVF